MKRFLFLSFLFLLTAGALQAQYFGRNKPRYEKQDFKVMIPNTLKSTNT